MKDTILILSSWFMAALSTAMCVVMLAAYVR